MNELTDRERKVLALVAQGKRDAEIADRLHIRPRTAQSHMRNVLAKLRAPNRTAAVVMALADGTLDLAGCADRIQTTRPARKQETPVHE